MLMGDGMRCRSCGKDVRISTLLALDSEGMILAPDGSIPDEVPAEIKSKVEEALEKGRLTIYCMSHCDGVRLIESIPAASWPWLHAEEA